MVPYGSLWFLIIPYDSLGCLRVTYGSLVLLKVSLVSLVVFLGFPIVTSHGGWASLTVSSFLVVLVSHCTEILWKLL